LTLRRSVALPSALIGELKAVAPPELRTNLNRLVILSLQEYVARRRREEFARALAAMAEDPQVQAECAAIARDFAVKAGNKPERGPSWWFRATPSTVSRS
jgi:transcription elongation factor